MHDAAYQFVKSVVGDPPFPFQSVLEVGARDLNGSVRPLFNASRYVGLDLHPGPGVDRVADILTIEDDKEYDAVVCCEVFEHLAEWRSALDRIFRALQPKGVLILTCAGPGRPAHSGLSSQFSSVEHYENVGVEDLGSALSASGFAEVNVEQNGTDVYATAVKP